MLNDVIYVQLYNITDRKYLDTQSWLKVEKNAEIYLITRQKGQKGIGFSP